MFDANNTTFFGIPPLKAQNDYMFKKLGGHGPIGFLDYAYE